MRNFLFLFVMVLFMTTLNAQTLQSSKTKRADKNTTLLCFYVDQDGKEHWIKTAKKPTEKQIIKIQMQLLFLGYTIVETGVLDEQTKRELAIFNKNNDLGNYPYILPRTQALLKAEYKIKKKDKKSS